MKKQSAYMLWIAVFAVTAAHLCVVSVAEEATAHTEKNVVLGGQVIGVKLYTKGVHVLKLSDVETATGFEEPAKKAGIKRGDYITQVDGTDVLSYEQFADLIQNKTTVTLTVSRNGESFKTSMKTAVGKDGAYRAGMWVRDSIAGIGTVTFYDPETHKAVALGHGITDTDTGKRLEPADGRAYAARVSSVVKGEKGTPGALNGEFSDESGYMGDLSANTEFGAYFDFAEFSGQSVPVANHQQVQRGEAVIYATVNGETVKPYTVKIKTVIRSSIFTSKGMILEVTDSRLLQATGGIVCGMSGSPIVQNGRLVGAVTHVFVNDPTKGYGVFIGNMLENNKEN